MKVVVTALISSIIAIVNILGIIVLIWLIFAILGVSLFGGKFYSCSDSGYTTQSSCLQAGYHWQNLFYNFDNVLEALITLFTISSQEAWPDRMYEGIDAVDVGIAPKFDNNPVAAYYYVIYVVIGNFFLVNVFTAVVYDRFNHARKAEKNTVSYLLTRDQINWLELQELIVKSKPKNIFTKKTKNCMPEKFIGFVTSRYFDSFMIFVIVLNTICMSIIYYGASEEYVKGLEIVNQTCTYIGYE
jgi:hypothetical protein